jgi:hypothetical protein
MYLMPHADAFKPTFPTELIAALAGAAAADKHEAGEVVRFRRALANGQTHAGNLASVIQVMRDKDHDALIGLFAEGGTEMPAYAGGTLLEEYSRTLLCIEGLVAHRLPTANVRAVRARGQKLVAGSRVMDEYGRQRLVWSNYLMAPVQEFEGNGVELGLLENGLPVSQSGRVRQNAGKMFAAGLALVRRADEAERNGEAVSFDSTLGSEWDWFFSKLEPLLNPSAPATQEQPCP